MLLRRQLLIKKIKQSKKHKKHKNLKRTKNVKRSETQKEQKNKRYKKCTCAPAISTSYLFHFPQLNKLKLGRGFRDFRPCFSSRSTYTYSSFHLHNSIFLIKQPFHNVIYINCLLCLYKRQFRIYINTFSPSY